jgi:hypothetical protein
MFKLNVDTAELVGILLGDGSFYLAKYNNEVDIALHTKDVNYKNYVKSLLKKVTSAYVFEKYDKKAKCVHIRISSKVPTMNLLKISYKKPGNKIKNRVSIPEWIWKKDRFLKACLRGLIDTDGSVYRLKPQWPNLTQISFKNNNDRLLKDVRQALKNFGLNPSKVFGNRVVVTRQKEVGRYFDIIGSYNDTHLSEYDIFLKLERRIII